MIVTIHAPLQPGTHAVATDPKAPAFVISQAGEMLGTVPLGAVTEYLAGARVVELEAEAEGDNLRIIGPARKH